MDNKQEIKLEKFTKELSTLHWALIGGLILVKVLPHLLCKLVAKVDHTVFVPFARFDMDLFSVPVDIGQLEGKDFSDT